MDKVFDFQPLQGIEMQPSEGVENAALQGERKSEGVDALHVNMFGSLKVVKVDWVNRGGAKVVQQTQHYTSCDFNPCVQTSVNWRRVLGQRGRLLYSSHMMITMVL